MSKVKSQKSKVKFQINLIDQIDLNPIFPALSSILYSCHFATSLLHYFATSLLRYFTTSLFRYFTISLLRYFTTSLLYVSDIPPRPHNGTFELEFRESDDDGFNNLIVLRDLKEGLQFHAPVDRGPDQTDHRCPQAK